MPFYAIVLGVVIGLVWHWSGARFGPAAFWRWYRGGTADAASPATTRTLFGAGNDTETRAHRLRRLCDGLSELTDKTAHSRELIGEPAFQEMLAILADKATPQGEVLDYAFGNSWPMSCAALAALAKRENGSTAGGEVVKRFGQFGVWQMAFALDALATLGDAIPAGAPLLQHEQWWTDTPLVRREFELHFTRLAERDAKVELGDAVLAATEKHEAIRGFLASLKLPFANQLATLLPGAPSNNAPDEPTGSETTSSTFLGSIGRFWTVGSELERPILPDRWREGLTAARTTIDRAPMRSLLVTGEPLAGKTSFLKILAEQLGDDGWRVFESGGADLQAGQMYIGQLEGRIRQAVEELASSGKAIWYVPDLLGLALSGTHQSQSASILDQMLPAVASGRLIIWAECSPASAARLLQLRPALRRIFEVVRLDPLDAEETRPLAEALSAKLASQLKLVVDRSFAETAIESAQHYLSASQLPGAALSLMRVSVLRVAESKDRRLDGHDVLETLSQLTGLPRSILDGSERLDLATVRAFFASRVIGQDEAVESIVERIAMLKSGLNDPKKPFGVFLFAGPTGTGKTELAKAIAEYLFGGIDRMSRLDMSEYQSPDSIAKIIGGQGVGPDADTLIARVRKQPFSLILLDEFEKSASQIWDLCLQIFDEGRLTDANGQTADFRHSLIILTTNLGATSHQSTGLGFAPGQAIYTSDQVLRAIGQTFRPEFQNRLDKVIVFRPLTRELMRGILKKELTRLYERRGLKDRGWAVEWEGSALEFLLEKGFSPDMGARPLKRAIDQYVVAPLAAAIVERRAPEGEQFVFLRSDGQAIQAEFVDPDGDDEPDTAGAPPPAGRVNGGGRPQSLAQIMLAPEGTPEEMATLAEAQGTLATRIAAPEWEAEKARISATFGEAGFWSRPDRFAVLSRFELMDRLAVAADTAASLQARLARGRRQPGTAARDIHGRLAMQVWLVNEGLKDLDEDAPVEVALVVEATLDRAGTGAERRDGLDWPREILDMYRAWCRLRHMQLSEIEPLGAQGLPVAVISGFGAHRILAREAGLHVLEQAEAAGSGGQGRVAARVVIVPSPAGGQSKAQLRSALTDAFAKTPRIASVVRRYRREPSPLVRNADGSWRSGKLDAVLAGQFDIMSAETP